MQDHNCNILFDQNGNILEPQYSNIDYDRIKGTKKSIIAPKMSDEEFMRLVKYYNRELDLNTYAKDVVNRYVKWSFKYN